MCVMEFEIPVNGTTTMQTVHYLREHKHTNTPAHAHVHAHAHAHTHIHTDTISMFKANDTSCLKWNFNE